MKARSRDRAFCFLIELIYQHVVSAWCAIAHEARGPITTNVRCWKRLELQLHSTMDLGGYGSRVALPPSLFELRRTRRLPGTTREGVLCGRISGSVAGRITAYVPMPKRIDQSREYRRTLMTGRREQRMV